MAKIFLTGATGYIGGSALHRIASSFPRVKISCLVRDASKGSIVRKAYPNVQVVEGDLDGLELIEREAAAADIVLHLASTNHLPSAKAILKGLSAGTRTQPRYWIQMSGATMVAAAEIKAGRYGEPSNLSYDDIRDDTKVRSLIKENPARAVDNLVITQDASTVRTALIAGPCFYGEGDGPVNTRSIQCPEIARATLERKKGFRLGKGENVWSNVHAKDLGEFFAALVKAAVEHNDKAWNENGLYFPSHASLSFKEICSAIAKEAQKQGLIDSSELDLIDADEANKLSYHGAALWGTNANMLSSRAQSQLGWKPRQGSLLDSISDVVRGEAERLGLKQK